MCKSQNLCKGAMVILIWNGFSALATVYDSDGSSTNIQYIHDSLAQNGDTITLPAGTFTWSTPVTISKAIKLQGEGSGRIIGDTKTSTMIGTGLKTFETTRSGLPISVGQTLRVAKMPGNNQPARDAYMEGTVTSYSGTTLEMNVTSAGGLGTWTFWWIATQPTTTIINNYNNGQPNNPGATPMLKIQQTTAGSAEISRIQFIAAPTSVSSIVGIRADAYAMLDTLVHDCWFETGNGSNGAAIYSDSNKAVVWNCSFDDTYQLSGTEAFQLKATHGVMDASWSTNSTMGTDDVNGANNFYIEDCDFHAKKQVCDADDNSRVVIRHCVWDNSQFANHGADTSNIGTRHCEIYDNELIFDVFPGNCATEIDLQHAIWIRGGTGIITDNVLPRIESMCAGTKQNISFSVLNTRRNSGAYCCWVGYPAPHQVGQGYGPGAVFRDWIGCQGQSADYYIYAEPIYVWNNAGTGGNLIGLTQDGTDACGNNQQVSDYVQEGRDYVFGPKPGYQKFTYPHPLRSGAPSPTPTATPTPAPTSTPDPSPTPTVPPSPTPTATATPMPTPSPSPTSTASPTPTATPRHTPKPHPSHGPYQG